RCTRVDAPCAIWLLRSGSRLVSCDLRLVAVLRILWTATNRWRSAPCRQFAPAAAHSILLAAGGSTEFRRLASRLHRPPRCDHRRVNPVTSISAQSPVDLARLLPTYLTVLFSGSSSARARSHRSRAPPPSRSRHCAVGLPPARAARRSRLRCLVRRRPLQP